MSLPGVPWCQPDDIRDNVAGTDQGTGTCAQLTDDQLNAAIGKAASKVASYTGTSWLLDAASPQITVPGLVVDLTVAIGTFYATLTYRKGKDLSAFDPVWLGYQDALGTLRDIISGNIQLNPTPPGDGPSTANRVINTVPRTFGYDDSGTMLNPVTRRVEPEGAPGYGWGGWSGSY